MDEKVLALANLVKAQAELIQRLKLSLTVADSLLKSKGGPSLKEGWWMEMYSPVGDAVTALQDATRAGKVGHEE